MAALTGCYNSISCRCSCIKAGIAPALGVSGSDNDHLFIIYFLYYNLPSLTPTKYQQLTHIDYYHITLLYAKNSLIQHSKHYEKCRFNLLLLYCSLSAQLLKYYCQNN